MIEKKIKLYEFNELSEDVQKKVLDRERSEIEYYGLEEDINFKLKEILKKYNISYTDDLEIRYSLSYCQGDGVSFTGSFEYEGYKIKINLSYLSNHYCHYNTTDKYIYKYDDDGNEIEAEDKIYEEFKDLYYDICKELEDFGYSWIDAEESDENLILNIKYKNVLFRENGDEELFIE